MDCFGFFSFRSALYAFLGNGWCVSWLFAEWFRFLELPMWPCWCLWPREIDPYVRTFQQQQRIIHRIFKSKIRCCPLTTAAVSVHVVGVCVTSRSGLSFERKTTTCDGSVIVGWCFFGGFFVYLLAHLSIVREMQWLDDNLRVAWVFLFELFSILCRAVVL